MTGSGVERRLSVILAADVVGYSRLMEADEEATVQALNTHRQFIDNTISDHRGRIFGSAGDSVIAEFLSPVEAVRCAVKIQQGVDSPEPSYMQFRIGINLGDVIVEGENLLGDGVNIAARLESIADPGGITLSRSVYEQVRKHLDLSYVDMGEQQLKNIADEVHVYKVVMADAESQANQSHDVNAPPKLSPEIYEVLVGERLELPDNPSIAVLPFQNISGDPEQEYFADGMSENIITALSQVPNLIVIARNSALVYKNRAIDVRQVGQELGVEHVLEGSIRKGGRHIRVSTQLVNTSNSETVWAEHYDRTLENIFDIQDEITRNIVVELQVKLGPGELSRVTASGTKNVKAWELIMRAGALTEAHSPDDTGVAKQLTKRALELDKNYSHAWVIWGWVHWQESVFSWSSNPEKSMQMAFDAANKAISADADNPSGYSLLGSIHMARDNESQAIETCRKAIEMAPGNSYSVAYLANVLTEFGHLAEGVQKMKRAIRLCPFPPAWYFMILGAALHLSGNNEVANITLNLVIERNSNSYFARLWLASTLVELGRLDEARAVSKAALDIEPSYSALRWAENFKSKSHARLKGNLIAAGFSD